MKDSLTQAQQRARAYWFADGLNEIISGIFATLYGGLILLATRAKSGAAQKDMLDTTVNIFLLVGVFLTPILLRWMKERSTYPRSGYIAYPELKTAERLRRVIPVMIIAFLLVALLAASLLASAHVRLWVFTSMAWLPTAMCVLFGVFFIRSAQATGLSRHFLLGCLSLVTAAWLGWRSLPLMSRLSLGLFAGDGFGTMPLGTASVMQDLMTAVYSNAALWLILMGVSALVLGMVARYNYLRETKNARPE
jgi:hypothetical protein